jgi:hypothetical protein
MAEVILEPARVFLGLLVVLNGFISLGNAGLAHEMPYTRGLIRGLMWVALWARWGLPGLVYAALVMAWAVQIHPYWTGTGAIAMLYFARWVEQGNWSGTIVKTLGVYSPAATCMMALLLGDWIFQYAGVGEAPVGFDISAGVLGASWTICGINKVQQSGFGWAGRKNMGLLVAERTNIGPPLGDKLRRFVMNQPGTLRLIGAVGLGLELGGVLFCVPELRMVFAALVVLFLVMNYILLGFFEHEWGLVMVAVAMGTV